MLEQISLQDAKAQGRSRFFTGVPCINGHLDERFVSSKACVVCARANQNKWDAKNTDKLRQYVSKYDAANRKTRRDAARLYRLENAASANKATREYRKRNPSLITALGAERRATVLKATPKWVDRQQLKKVYEECRFLTEKTGMQYEVDHIVPLKNKYVCGLHVPCNLQIILATENRRKNNLYESG